VYINWAHRETIFSRISVFFVIISGPSLFYVDDAGCCVVVAVIIIYSNAHGAHQVRHHHYRYGTQPQSLSSPSSRKREKKTSQNVFFETAIEMRRKFDWVLLR
jgi:hypothetical protein